MKTIFYERIWDEEKSRIGSWFSEKNILIVEEPWFIPPPEGCEVEIRGIPMSEGTLFEVLSVKLVLHDNAVPSGFHGNRAADAPFYVVVVTRL